MKREREDELKIYYASFTKLADTHSIGDTTKYGFFTDKTMAETFLLKNFKNTWRKEDYEHNYDEKGSFEDIQRAFDEYLKKWEREYIEIARYSYTYMCIEESNVNKIHTL